MTLDKFGRHIEDHKSKKFIDENIKLHLKSYSDEVIEKISTSFRSVVVINLRLYLKESAYDIVNSNSGVQNYIFPVDGVVKSVKTIAALNYRINDLPRISILENKKVVSGDELKIYPYPTGKKHQNLYLELILECPLYNVKN